MSAAGLLVAAFPLQAQDEKGGHVHRGSLPPIGVKGGHAHEAGSWMLSYRFMRMEMDGNLDGTSHVSGAEIVAPGGRYRYVVAPESMTMDMHMLGLMLGLTNEVTFMAMVPFLDLSMDHSSRPGISFELESDGIGDVRTGGVFLLHGDRDHQLLFNGVISIPTGSIDETAFIPVPPPGGVGQLAYPMQLGSGTWDLLPALTLVRQEAGWAWGLQYQQTLRLGENDADYRLGNRSDVTGWVSRDLGDSTTGSLRLSGARWGDIHGNDSRLPSNLPTPSGYGVPTANPALRGGTRVDVGLGVDVTLPGFASGQTFGVELGIPVFQNLDGPQLATDWSVTFGWRFLN